MELAQESDFPVTQTQDGFARNSRPLPPSSQAWAARRKTLSIEDVKLRQCKLGELGWLVSVSRPDICARLARITSRVNSSQGGDAYRKNDLAETVKVWQQAASLRYSSSPHLRKPVRGDGDGETRQRGGEIHEGTMTLAGGSDAGCGDLSTQGGCRLGFEIGLMPSTFRGPCLFF